MDEHIKVSHSEDIDFDVFWEQTIIEFIKCSTKNS